ncbi:hypothetical protein A5625_26570 [Mycobacterium sp. 1465703.0]|nr:hypothetical protein A5625_26570 [Mycobacterium sp. 1465703.0]
MTGFGHLKEPQRIGAITACNRVSASEKGDGMLDGPPSERTCDYSGGARGGTGLITLRPTGIDRRHREAPGGLRLAATDDVGAYRTLVEAVHQHRGPRRMRYLLTGEHK